MKDTLQEKLKTFSIDKLQTFYQIEPMQPYDYIWEQTDAGMYLYREDAIHYFSSCGKIYKLTPNMSMTDWDNHVLLYDEVSKNTDIRMEIPIHCEICGENVYNIVQRPNFELGNDIFHDVLNNKVSTQYFIDIIDNFTELLDIINHLNKTNYIGHPYRMPKPIFDSKGCCWTDFKIWFLEDCSYSYASQLLKTIIWFEQFGIIVDKTVISNHMVRRWSS